jgi:ubiquinone/menaquinone biosynthesis C-methylase UbiE
MIYQNPDPCLAEVKRVLKDDGIVSDIYVFTTTKVKSINSKLYMQNRVGRFVTNRQRYTSSVGNILQ